jgi:hypothetical protein
MLEASPCVGSREVDAGDVRSDGSGQYVELCRFIGSSVSLYL